MSEIIVKLNEDRIRLKGGEYIQDLLRCKECINHNKDTEECDLFSITTSNDDFCSKAKYEF